MSCRYVKGVHSRSLTVRNLQLSLFGLPFSLLYMYLKDGGAHNAGGFMIGFDALAWAVVGLQVRLPETNSTAMRASNEGSCQHRMCLSKF